MVKMMFACLNKLPGDLKCKDTNCVFNSQGKSPRCEYFDDEPDISEHLEYLSTGYIPEDLQDAICEES